MAFLCKALATDALFALRLISSFNFWISDYEVTFNSRDESLYDNACMADSIWWICNESDGSLLSYSGVF